MGFPVCLFTAGADTDIWYQLGEYKHKHTDDADAQEEQNIFRKKEGFKDTFNKSK